MSVDRAAWSGKPGWEVDIDSAHALSAWVGCGSYDGGLGAEPIPLTADECDAFAAALVEAAAQLRAKKEQR